MTSGKDVVKKKRFLFAVFPLGPRPLEGVTKSKFDSSLKRCTFGFLKRETKKKEDFPSILPPKKKKN